MRYNKKFVGKLSGNLLVYRGPEPPTKRTNKKEMTKKTRIKITATMEQVFHQGLPEISLFT